MKKNLLNTSILISAAAIIAAFFSQTANAVTADDWKAGRIIDDAVFTNANEMSVDDIDRTLKQRLPFCDIYGSKRSELGGGTRAQYGAANGNPTPFTCLTGYYEVPKTSPGTHEPINNYGRYDPDGSPYIPPGAKSASQLIYDAAQKYSINPKALIIKLATESPGPLTSDEWPFKRQYLYAMGAHCPDSGPGGSANCDVNYSGFSLQMDEAAKLLRWYLDSMDKPWWRYKVPYTTNSVLWNVEPSGCGAGNVYIESKATAALYTYTPYQPNQAALKNMYGTGDRCSAYGNRNFWRVWNEWFGSTIINEFVPKATLSPKNSNYCRYLKPVPYAHTSYCHSSLVGDFNGDKYQDVAVFYQLSDGKSFGMWVFPGSPTGLQKPVFQRGFAAADYWDINTIKFAAGDVNGDNIDDIVALVRSPHQGVTIVEINGSPSQFLAGSPTYKYNPAIFDAKKTGWLWSNIEIAKQAGDFNGDSYEDIAVNYVMNDGKSFNLWVFPGSQTGLQSPIIQRGFAASQYWNIQNTKFLTGDFNGDRLSDLAMLVYSPTGGVSLVQTFGNRQSSLSGPQKFTYDPSMFDAPKTGWYWDSVDPIRFTSDATGDLTDDILVTYTLNDKRSTNLWLIPGSVTGLSSPVFQQSLPSSKGYDITSSRFVVGDFRNDWVADVNSLNTDQYGGVFIYDINGDYTNHAKSTPSKKLFEETYKAVYTGWYWNNLR